MTATAPADVITLFAAALHDDRLDDALALYEPDAVFIPQPGAEPLHGLDQIRAALAGFIALRPTLTPEIRKVVQAGDIATVLHAWTLDGTAPDGMALHLSGTSADVLRRRPDGSWGLLIDDPWGAQ
ncbi:SgcJ/EcaC family oxidoreductase [Actinoplanes sp. ATCC 53533]|uniref:YybH family protein n=1 Tax=Actinoplanes sp. ATCC 53533 TaxID=1288362 RepID=UPI00131525E3|nr:SgcJ/EcaC family oxidoreductase [Actinoplanes sp. ATCC 53533]